MTDLLLLLHSSDTTAGTTLKWCESRKVSYTIIDASKELDTVNVSEFKGAIVFGGNMEAWEVEKHPWLNDEKQLLSNFIQTDKRVFGICLGAQLIAEQLGAKISKMEFWEFGWLPVRLEADQRLVPMQAHGSGFSLPPHARRAATDDHDANQGFFFGKNIRGYQFHTEIDSTRMKQVIDGFSGEPGERVQSKDVVLENFCLYAASLEKWYFEQLDAWFPSLI